MGRDKRGYGRLADTQCKNWSAKRKQSPTTARISGGVRAAGMRARETAPDLPPVLRSKKTCRRSIKRCSAHEIEHRVQVLRKGPLAAKQALLSNIS